MPRCSPSIKPRTACCRPSPIAGSSSAPGAADGARSVVRPCRPRQSRHVVIWDLEPEASAGKPLPGLLQPGLQLLRHASCDVVGASKPHPIAREQDRQSTACADHVCAKKILFAVVAAKPVTRRA